MKKASSYFRLDFVIVIVLVCVFLPVSAFAQAKNQKPAAVEGLPYRWKFTPNAKKPVSGPGKRLSFGAGGETDLHYPASGAYRRHNAPMALVTPVGDFEFSAKVEPGFKAQYDGGALLLYSDTLNWAKILLQRSGTNPLVGMSVVRKGVTDDAYYPAADGGTMYFKISRAGQLCSFHASANGKDWTLTRQFVFSAPAPVQVGFYVQSPAGKGSRVAFSDIIFKSLQQ